MTVRPSVLHVVPATAPNPLLMGMVQGVDADFCVAAFGDGHGPLGQQCEAVGVPFVHLGPAESVGETVRGIRRVVGERAPDVVEAHTHGPSVAAAILAAMPGRRPRYLAVRHHNLNNYLHGSRFGRMSDRLVHRWVDGEVAVSRAVRDTCIAEGADPGRVHLALNGLDLRHLAEPHDGPGAPVSERRHRLLAVGRLDWQKDYPTLLAAVARLVDEGRDLELVVLGHGIESNVSELHGLSDRLGLQDRVRWQGWTTDVAGWLASSDVFVHAAADEAFGLVLIEAMAAGVPVVATAVGGSREVVEPLLPMVPPGDPVAFAARVAEVLDDLAVHRAGAGELRDLVVERFDPTQMARDHLAACREVMEGR